MSTVEAGMEGEGVKLGTDQAREREGGEVSETLVINSPLDVQEQKCPPPTLWHASRSLCRELALRHWRSHGCCALPGVGATPRRVQAFCDLGMPFNGARNATCDSGADRQCLGVVCHVQGRKTQSEPRSHLRSTSHA